MENNRLKEAQNSLEFWQNKLNMGDWSLSVKLVDFDRADYIQTGDFKVGPEREAVILISKTPTDKDIYGVILHELVHVLLWKMDDFSERYIGPKHRNRYMELLEETVDDLANRIGMAIDM